MPNLLSLEHYLIYYCCSHSMWLSLAQLSHSSNIFINISQDMFPWCLKICIFINENWQSHKWKMLTPWLAADRLSLLYWQPVATVYNTSLIPWSRHFWKDDMGKSHGCLSQSELFNTSCTIPFPGLFPFSLEWKCCWDGWKHKSSITSS